MAEAKKPTPPVEEPKIEPVPAANNTPEPQGLQNVRPEGPTGYHCGYCGAECGREGQHWNPDGEQVEVPHPSVMVLADNWAGERKP